MMKRFTTNKSVSDMNMVELAHNSCFAKNGEVYYRDYEHERSARDLARDLSQKFADIDMPLNDDEFEEEMLDFLQYDACSSPIGFVALFYRNLCAMADLYETLKKYEDAIDKIESRIKDIKNSSDFPHNFKGQMIEDLEWVLNQLI